MTIPQPPYFVKRTKTQIKAMLKQHGTLIIKILPSKANPNSPWFSGAGTEVKSGEELEALTSSCKYYMCNKELGMGVAYWVDGRAYNVF